MLYSYIVILVYHSIMYISIIHTRTIFHTCPRVAARRVTVVSLASVRGSQIKASRVMPSLKGVSEPARQAMGILMVDQWLLMGYQWVINGC